LALNVWKLLWKNQRKVAESAAITTQLPKIEIAKLEEQPTSDEAIELQVENHLKRMHKPTIDT
jgi:hypothetical protein